MSQMIRHIVDTTIDIAVDRLADEMHSRSPESNFATNMIDLFFEGPEGEQRRGNIRARLRKEFDRERIISITRWDSFGGALLYFEGEVDQSALEYAADHMKEMVDAVTRT